MFKHIINYLITFYIPTCTVVLMYFWINWFNFMKFIRLNNIVIYYDFQTYINYLIKCFIYLLVQLYLNIPKSIDLINFVNYILLWNLFSYNNIVILYYNVQTYINYLIKLYTLVQLYLCILKSINSSCELYFVIKLIQL